MNPSHARHLSWASLALVVVSACGAEIPPQIVTGQIAQPARGAVRGTLRAFDSARSLRAASAIDDSGRFLLGLPPGEVYEIDLATADSGPAFLRSIDSQELVHFRVCRVTSPVELTPLRLAPFRCREAPECQSARDAAQACRDEVTAACDPLGAQVEACHRDRELGCMSAREALAECQRRGGPCDPETQAVDLCLRRFDCEARESEFVSACAAPCASEISREASVCVSAEACVPEEFALYIPPDAQMLIGCEVLAR